MNILYSELRAFNYFLLKKGFDSFNFFSLSSDPFYFLSSFL